jgi:hypothetical protein
VTEVSELPEHIGRCASFFPRFNQREEITDKAEGTPYKHKVSEITIVEGWKLQWFVSVAYTSGEPNHRCELEVTPLDGDSIIYRYGRSSVTPI